MISKYPLPLVRCKNYWKKMVIKNNSLQNITSKAVIRKIFINNGLAASFPHPRVRADHLKWEAVWSGREFGARPQRRDTRPAGKDAPRAGFVVLVRRLRLASNCQKTKRHLALGQVRTRLRLRPGAAPDSRVAQSWGLSRLRRYCQVTVLS